MILIKKVFINSKVILDDSVSDEAFGVYVALRSLISVDNAIQYINCEQLSYMLTGAVDFKKRFLQLINAGINELVNIGLVNFNEVISCDAYILDLSPLIFKTDKADRSRDQEYYAVVTLDEIRKCINGRSNYRFKFLRYLCFLVNSFRNDIGFTSIENISIDLKIDTETVMSNNKKLEKLKLIYIYRSTDYTVDSDGNMFTIPNTYGRFDDKQRVIQAGKEYEEQYGCKAKKKKSTNSRLKSNQIKSIVMKYKCFCKGTKYDYETLKMIYNGVVEYNSKYKDKPPMSLTVFSGYDFYKKE